MKKIINQVANDVFNYTQNNVIPISKLDVEIDVVFGIPSYVLLDVVFSKMEMESC